LVLVGRAGAVERRRSAFDTADPDGPQFDLDGVVGSGRVTPCDVALP
jgi:hypothetical protein